MPLGFYCGWHDNYRRSNEMGEKRKTEMNGEIENEKKLNKLVYRECVGFVYNSSPTARLCL